MKHLKLFLALALVLVAVFALASCDCEEHNFEVTATVEATCTAGGSITYTCSECEATYTEYTSRIDHTYTDKVVEATCDALGYTEHTCACGRSFKDTYTAKKEHNYVTTVVAATCTAPGATKHECSLCGDAYETDVVPMLDHTYVKQTPVAPACGQMGYTPYVCSCGASYQSDLVAALSEHSYVAKTVAATHTADGYTEYTCTCGNSYKTDIVPALGHEYTVKTTDPTCTEDGKTVSTCSCGDTKTEVIPALGHKVGTVIEQKEPDCGVDGYSKYTCSRCDKTIEEEYISDGHLYKVTEDIPGSCVDGKTVYTCSCGDSYTVVNPATGSCVYDLTMLPLSDEEKQLNPDTAILYKEVTACVGCGTVDQTISSVYEYLTFDGGLESLGKFSLSGDIKTFNGGWILEKSTYVTDGLHLVSRNNSALKDYTISFDVIVNSNPGPVDYDPSTNTGAAKPPIFFALIDGSNKWDYKNPALGLDKTSMDANGGYELRLYRHNWSSKPSTSHATGYFMELDETYSIKMDFAVVGSTYKVTLSVKRGDEIVYTELGTYDLNGDYGNATSYLYFEGKGNVYSNFKVTGDIQEYVDPTTCNHIYELSAVEPLSEAEKKANPYAIGREFLTCSQCTPLDGSVYSVYGNAVYEYMTFDSKFDNHENTSTDAAPSVSGGKYTASSNAFYLTDNLNLVSGGSTKIKDYNISFDVVLNYVPTTAIGETKYHAFFDIRSSSNKWENKSPALVINKDSTDANGGYELYVNDNSWSGKPNNGSVATGYFMELGEEYSIKMNFTYPGSNKRTLNLYIKKAGEADYTLVATKDCVYWYGEGSFFVFHGAGNVYDNFAITGSSFTEVQDPSTCLHNWDVSIVPLTDLEKAANPYVIGREERSCPKCGTTELGDALYEYMTFNTEFGNHANLTPASTPTVSGGKWTLGGSLYITDSLHLVSRGNSALKDYSISFDVTVNHDPSKVDYDPSTNTGSKKPPIFFALIDGQNKWDYKNPSLGLDKTSKDANGGYELRIYRHDWSKNPSTSAATGFFMELGKEYSIKMDFLVDGSTYKVTLYAKAVESDTYTSLVTHTLQGSYGNATSYIYFEGAGNVYDNFKISGAFTEVIDPSTCSHDWDISIAALTDAEKAANPYVIGREERNCPKCGTTELGDALYEYMSFNTEFGNHANTSTDATPSVSGGKYTATANEFFLTDNLNLVSGRNTKIKDYSISFDVTLNYVPTTGISDNKYHAFFDIRSSSNKWENKSPALMINKDSKNEAGGYELYLLDNSWSGTANSFKAPTGYFMELGKEYSIKMDFTYPGSNKRTVDVYIKAVGEADYTLVATKDCVYWYGEGSFFVFRGAGNTYDNFKISGAFTEAN